MSSSSTADREIATAQILQDLYTHWQPHPAQAKILNAIFYEGITDVLVECGRKFGKSWLAGDALRRWALFHPGAACYYVSPLFKQSREIMWVTRRFHDMIPSKYIAKINNTEMRITLTNGSFVKLEGSDNVDAMRGTSPHFLVYDEYKDMSPGYHTAVNPNRAVHNAPLLVLGTPPESEGVATDMKEEFLAAKNSRYYNLPTWENPHISREWLQTEKERLFSRGEEDTWFREYEAKFVKGGKNSIFPMLDESKHRIAHHKILAEVQRDMRKLDWFCIADPGSTSVFAVLFAAYNRFNKTWYFIDEIYETDQRETSVARILPRIQTKIENIAPTANWAFIFDEAAQWFFTEASGIGDRALVYPWTPTNKVAMQRDPLTKEPWGLSLIKDLLRLEKFKASDKCEKLWWEMSNYTRTRNRGGDVKILKRDDHLIDCIRYGIEYSGFTIRDLAEPVRDEEGVRRKVYTIEQDLAADNWMAAGLWGPFAPDRDNE